MKHSLLQIALVVGPAFLLALSNISTALPKDDGLPVGSGTVERSELVEIDGIFALENGTAFTGTVVDHHPNGVRKARFDLVDGKAHGAWIEWYSDGAVRFYSEWLAGLGEGPFLYFHPNGEIQERVTARADRWDGLAEGWRPDGSKAFERFYKDGELISERLFGQDREGKP